MKIPGHLTFVSRIATTVALVAVLLPVPSEAAGKTQPKQHVELSMTGPVFTVPDHTGRIYPDLSEWDQCREGDVGGTGFHQRLTTMNLAALGFDSLSYGSNLPYPAEPGVIRRQILLDFGAKSAGPGSPVVFSFFLTSNCQFLVPGFIVSGQWPLLGGSPGPELIVTIPAGSVWSFKRYGGGAAQCSGSAILSEDVIIAIRRNETRTSNLCDCPSEYQDADVVACP
jgi:hypothetical protein